MDNAIVLVGPEQTKMFRLISMKHAAKLELMGMRHSRGSVIAQIKREFGFKGNRESVVQQFSKHVTDLLTGLDPDDEGVDLPPFDM